MNCTNLTTEFRSLGEVWVLEYSHKHGVDCAYYLTEEDAKLAALEIVNNYRDELDISPDVTNEEALDNWNVLTNDVESIWYHCESIRTRR
ncbi:hypothetical protein H6G17_08980 [Chroococcidiopsis sp. FACHB-1243]|uniref:hypothetical protein n=1 Tax=Chroococcidiopsis sp. [FACHB-1243] TaxID=2692781 RepID=UPI001782B554|nr:hypothetical protein [Chroococcidiopsis sp. [FACHB-1243]]MBD2305650.1 hypothetical protein [Chroococcidiopsis sp. [FACHB-1243]]